MPVADLLRRHSVAWSRATRHPFLVAVRDGTVSATAFAEWLVQDYRFVGDLLRFQARLLARAPRGAQPVLARGAVALVEELAWFERQAAVGGLDLDAEALTATAAYATLLQRLDSADVPVALVGLWALERSYLDAWSYASPGAPPYREFVEHWTTPQFAAYVGGLEAAADAVVATAGAASDVEVVFAEVVEAESRFWDMAWPGRAP